MTFKTGTELIEEAKARVAQVSPAEALEADRREVVFLDVREPNEWNLGRIPGAVHIPRGTLEGKIEAAIPRESNIIIYCASGNRSALAADTIEQMGYANVSSLAEGFRGWVEAGGDVES